MMGAVLRWFRLRLFGIAASEVSFARRGFPDDGTGAREHLERAGGGFVSGYNIALRRRRTGDLCAELDDLPADLRGFAYEGASMALVILDLIQPWSASRWRKLLDAAGDRHCYLCFVGAGWAAARLRMRRLPRLITDADSLLSSLAADGYGFHQAFFNPGTYVRRQAPHPLAGFDQGVGRSLWFVDGANPARIAATIAAFPARRRADLWSGVGLAAAYAGSRDDAAVIALANGAGVAHSSFAQGVAFAVAARARSGNLTAATERTCRIVWNEEAQAVVRIVDDALLAASQADRFESWRRNIRSAFGGGEGRDLAGAVTP